MEVIDHKVILTEEEKKRCKEDWWFNMYVTFRQISEDCAGRQPYLRMAVRKQLNKYGDGEICASWPLTPSTFTVLSSGKFTALCLDKACFATQINQGRKKRKPIADRIQKKIELLDKMTEGKYKIWAVLKDDLYKLVNTE